MMNWKVFGRNRSLSNRSTIQQLSGGTEKTTQRETSVSIAGVPAEAQTELPRNTSPEHYNFMQNVLGRRINILGGHNIDHSEQKCVLYVQVSYSERFPK